MALLFIAQNFLGDTEKYYLKKRKNPKKPVDKLQKMIIIGTIDK